MSRSLSVAAISVLHAVASGVAYGFDVIEATGLSAGTVYPALTRMESDGLLQSDWEPIARARADKRPPRRYYRITARGLVAMNEALARMHALRPIRQARAGRGSRS
jgi:DNA-binding PadR family transcriptional regulator